MSASRFKPVKKIADAPLPKRNRRAAMVRRVAAKITNQAEFDRAMATYPPYMREAWIEELRSYLKFEPREVTGV